MASLIKLLSFALLTFFGPLHAQAVTYPASPSAMPEYTLLSAPQTSLPVRIKPGKPETVHLDADAGRVIVDDKPKNISATIYDSRSIVLFPHNTTGGAHFTVFGKDGKPIMARYAIINDPEKKYIRLHQVCKTGHDSACDRTDVYFCPNFCYQTHLVGAAAQTAAAK